MKREGRKSRAGRIGRENMDKKNLERQKKRRKEVDENKMWDELIIESKERKEEKAGEEQKN